MTRTELAHGRLAGLDEIVGVGRDTARGGYSRHVWQPAELELRAWFIERAHRVGLEVETDRNGNMWAWWGQPGQDAVVVGSHLDSVPGGGEFDGPLGVVSALDAVAILQSEGVRPARPCAVVVFAEEEGSRFGVACLGSRLLTGSIAADRVRALVDADGVTFAEAAASSGIDPRVVGHDPETLGRIGVFIELHVEQGRGLIDLDAPIAVASRILAHGRWRIDFTGEGNHAGTTGMSDRRDPMVAAARGIVAVRNTARDDDRATVGRVEVVPGGTNVIPSRVTTWLDARSDRDEDAQTLVTEIVSRVRDAAAAERCDVRVTEESWSGRVAFDPTLRDRLVDSLGGIPVLPTGAGHDAGVLAAHVPTAMLFVRNPSGISHAPEEHAAVDDCVAGVVALTKVLRGML